MFMMWSRKDEGTIRYGFTSDEKNHILIFSAKRPLLQTLSSLDPQKGNVETKVHRSPGHGRPTAPPTGSQIEIISNHPGFRGSWYTGVIVKHAPPKKPNKFVVEYTHLFEDDAGTKPLRVITKELENGRFHVYFKRSKEQLEFGEDQLRLHRGWIKGSWTPPLEEDEQVKLANKSTEAGTERKIELNNVREKLEHDNTASKRKLKSDLAGSGGKLESGKITEYSEGERVEVTSDEDGFEGAWFTGTIVKAVGKNKYLFQYDSLRTDDDSEFLKEEFVALNIRPCPPEIVMANAFQKLDEVDAFYNEVWWVGVISKVIKSLPETKYEVYFKATQEEMKFKHSELRMNQDWINGKWDTASKKPSVINAPILKVVVFTGFVLIVISFYPGIKVIVTEGEVSTVLQLGAFYVGIKVQPNLFGFSAVAVVLVIACVTSFRHSYAYSFRLKVP
ncbi:Peroxidase 31, putative isoform 1 [Hibiscus syriacus]|uniref:Peroxidase 31, putative isoform 1 n=1 Tax=Hibiscus syriacus TaxID=106335 RepID=A0A6A2Y429_HIBSY|nr:Peroxidase 31, putative isoform 1 [Hibiscus syriacus]